MSEIHYLDERRPRGKRSTGPRAESIQLPVICAVDVVEYAGTYGARDENHATTNLSRVTCRDCRDRVMEARGRLPHFGPDGRLRYVSIPC